MIGDDCSIDPFTKPCGNCGESGFVNEVTCWMCRGTGRTPTASGEFALSLIDDNFTQLAHRHGLVFAKATGPAANPAAGANKSCERRVEIVVANKTIVGHKSFRMTLAEAAAVSAMLVPIVAGVEMDAIGVTVHEIY